jgi:hypothetical protein
MAGLFCILRGRTDISASSATPGNQCVATSKKDFCGPVSLFLCIVGCQHCFCCAGIRHQPRNRVADVMSVVYSVIISARQRNARLDRRQSPV